MQGEILSIIGKNGTGKSSLLKVIAGIEKKFSWKLTVYTKNISYVPQKLQLEKSFPLSVQEFYTIFNDTFSLERLEELLSLFDIQKLLLRNIHELSGWEFQKVLISNALLREPELLLLDEPTSGIDVIGEEQFYENIAQIKETFPKLSIILVSHNLHLVYKNSSRVICLHENNFCCHGTPKQLQENTDIQKIFGDHVRPYQHHPHEPHTH